MIASNPASGGNGHGRTPTPGELAQAITGRDYLSWSQVSTYQACSLRWHFAYVERAKPERVSAAMLLGSSVHAAIQHHLECMMAADGLPTVDELMAVFHGTWKEEAGDIPVEYGREETEETQAETARRMLEAFLTSSYAKAEGSTVGIEEVLRVPLHAELPDLVAKIDHIAAQKGELVVTDFKTTRAMWGRGTADEHGEQLHLYAEAVKPIANDLGLPVRLRFVILTKAKSPRVDAIGIKLDPERVKRSRIVVRNVFKAMQTGVVYPSPSPINCSGCAFRLRCARWYREDAS